jgi:hypothetical protein
MGFGESMESILVVEPVNHYYDAVASLRELAESAIRIRLCWNLNKSIPTGIPLVSN